MISTNRIKFILLWLAIIAFGLLQIKYPNALHGFNDNYTGRGTAGLIMLIFEIVLILTWGWIGGSLSILLGIFGIVFCLLPDSNQVESKPSGK